jgi:hypothetical protein
MNCEQRLSPLDEAPFDREDTRSVVDGIVGKCKTETSRRPVPIDEFKAGELITWKCETCYAASDDWVFASERVQGRMPPWADTLLDRFPPTHCETGWDYEVGRLPYLPSLTSPRR